MSKLEVKPENHKIFIFKKIFDSEAAKQQAEKKKLNAFGLWKFNLLKRPQEDTVVLKQHILRYEPFWFVASKRTVNYTCLTTYSVPIYNRYASSVTIKNDVYEDRKYPAIHQNERSHIELDVVENCHRSIEYSAYWDGLKREMRSTVFENYIRKFIYHEVDRVDLENVLEPLLSLDYLTGVVRSELNRETISASHIQEDLEEISSLFLYFRPVYAFEYYWAIGDRTGIIEVDGLTGEVAENGSWFKDSFEQAFTKQNLIELSAELASTVVPGAGTAVRVASKLMNQ